MSSWELQRSTAPNPAESKYCGNDLDLVVAAAVLTTVLLGYCCILQRLSSAFCGSTPGNRSENPDAGDPTEEIGNAGQQITILRYLPIIRSRGNTSRNPVENPDADDPAQEIHSGGLELVILESLRVSEFRKNNEGEHSEGSATCAVCLGEFEEGQLLRHLPNCSHAFHLPCIDTWFEYHSNCPVCRSTAYDVTVHGDYSPFARPCQIAHLQAIYASSSESAFDSSSGPAF